MVIKVDVCVIGAGSGGLSVAVGAAQLGASTALIEDNKMGGDCLNYGCVPSKSLLAAAKVAHAQKSLTTFGLKASKFQVDYAGVHQHLIDVVSAIQPHDSQERMESLGIKVFRETAHFINAKELQVGQDIIRAKKFVIATGSTSSKPIIEGLNHVPYYTNETIFNAERPMEHLLIIGGGPIGLEMAQAHIRLGTKVTVLEMFRILPRDDEELVDVIRQKLIREGVTILEGISIDDVSFRDGRMRVNYHKGNKKDQVEGSHLLVAAGRHPNVSKLHLERAKVHYDPKGIHVDARLRTSNKNIYAIGDVIGQQQFTHAASYHASIVIRNMLFWLPAKVDKDLIPWVIYTDPELAHIGISEAQAERQHLDYQVLRFDFRENDRAQCEKKTEGLIKVIVNRRGYILGVDICGAHAGDLLPIWALAMSKSLHIGDIARLTLPYPTYSEVSKAVAGNYFKPRLFNDRVRRLVRFLLRFG